MRLWLTVVVAALALSTGCSLNDVKAYGPGEVVVYDDGDLVITSEKLSDISVPEVGQAQTMGVTAPSTANVWRISQEVLRYYRQGGTLYVSGQLKVDAGVKNLAYSKTVGIRYTVNNWASWTDSNGSWSYHVDSNNTDVFTIYSASTINPGATMKYAIYFKVSGQTYWDNNNSANYTAQF